MNQIQDLEHNVERLKVLAALLEKTDGKMPSVRMVTPVQGAEIMALVPADAGVPEGFVATP